MAQDAISPSIFSGVLAHTRASQCISPYEFGYTGVAQHKQNIPSKMTDMAQPLLAFHLGYCKDLLVLTGLLKLAIDSDLFVDTE